jgi:SAM-dependent methyltransferase
MRHGLLGRCPVCGATDNLLKIKENYDERYGYPGTFPLLKCTNCGHAFLKGEFSPELLQELYSSYYPRSTFDLGSHRPYQEISAFKAWLDGARSSAFRWVPRNVRVLDIGCGFGESLGYHQARGCDVYGVEADQTIRLVAERFGYKVHVGLFDPKLYPGDFFDYVTMDQVIEHVANPIATMRGISQILKSGGVAILSTPNAQGWGAKLFGRRWINWHTPYHLQFFSVRSMQLAAGQAGLILEQSKTITSSEWLYYQWAHLVTFPEMGAPSPFWSPNGKASWVQKVILRMLVTMHRTKINHFFTRLFDGLDVGDNRLFFLRKP